MSSDIADRYRRNAARFDAVLADVPDDRWDAESPCEGWTARQVVGHVAESQHGFLSRFDRAPEVTGDPLADWPVVRDAVQAGLDDPEVSGIEYDGMFGRTTFGATVDQFMCADLVVHAWDVARATGLPDHEPMPAEEVERIHGELAQIGPAMRSPGVFGPEVEVPADASAQDRFLGFIGRQP